MNMKLKWGTAGRLRRGAVILGVVGLTAGAAVATAGSALAANGNNLGQLTLSPASGPGSTVVTWSTSVACPAADQGSAVLEEFNTDGTPASRISGVINAPASPLSNEPVLAGSSMSSLLTSTNLTGAGTVEWAVGCFAAGGGTGTPVYVMNTYVTVNAAGAYTTSATPPVASATTTTLTATPNPVALSGTANMKAVVMSGSAFPAGNVQFENCPTPTTCTNIGAAVPVNTGGVEVDATAPFTAPATAGTVNLAAVFTPSAPASFAGSSGTFSLGVGSSLAGGTNPVSINVQVPSTGSLSVTVAAGSVTLIPASPQTTPDESASGTFNNVTITDSRNTFPGWAVMGQESVFTGPGTNTIPANSLGWTPAAVGTLGTGVILGGTVAPLGAGPAGTATGPGLGAAASLVQAHAPNGFGTNTVNAGLLLDIPSSTPPGAYAGTLTVTYLIAN